MRSSLAAAEVVGNELQQQSAELATAMQELGEDLLAGLSEATTAVTDRIDRLEDSICGSLDEIRWLAAQQAQTLEGVLETLHNSRSVEAQQLIRQGFRHLLFEELDEAEERLKLALSYDTTDHQVLINLAFIEIHKGNGDAAKTYFRRALTLPENLDVPSKKRALWALARLEYAREEYASALTTASSALHLESKPSGSALLAAGAYAALSGDSEQSLMRVRSAIEVEPLLFARVAVDPRLESVRVRVFSLLSELASSTRQKAKDATSSTAEHLSRLRRSSEELGSYRELTQAIEEKTEAAKARLATASYSDCIELTDSMSTLGAVLEEIPLLLELHANCHRLRHAADEAGTSYRRAGGADDPSGGLVRFAEHSMRVLSVATYFIPGLFATMRSASEGSGSPGTGEEVNGGVGCAMVLAWPLMYLLALIESCAGATYEQAQGIPYRDGVHAGVLLVVAFWVVLGILKAVGHAKGRLVSQRKIDLDQARGLEDEEEGRLQDLLQRLQEQVHGAGLGHANESDSG